MPPRRPPAAPKHGEPAGLPRPSSVSVAAFEGELFPFLNARRYAELGWAKDKGVRDTGPFLNGKYYGTHPAVRVWYSRPRSSRGWKPAGRGRCRTGRCSSRSSTSPPAERHAGKSEEELRASLESWTVMVKDSQGSRDGWFWSNPTPDAAPADNHATGEHPRQRVRALLHAVPRQHRKPRRRLAGGHRQRVHLRRAPQRRGLRRRTAAVPRRRFLAGRPRGGGG